jgi:6-phosphogluconolactonase
MLAYVGSYTTARRQARGNGINLYRVEDGSGAWTHVQQLGGLVNPSYLALDHKGRFLYAVHGDLDEISAFAVEGGSGRLSFVNRRSAGGVNPVHLAIDATDRFIVTANYANGTLSVVPIEEDGSLGSGIRTSALPGAPGPHRAEQTGSHPHHCPFDPSGRFVLVPDKGLDRTFVLRLDADKGELVPNDPPHVEARAGAAPRHIACHPALPYAYVINELDSTITSYAWDTARGALRPFQIVPSLPDHFTANNTGAEIAVAPSGAYLYVSNRGHDSIGTFAIERASGRLSAVGWTSTEGKKPRFFALDPSGTRLYAANEASDTIVAFRIEPASGELAATGQVVENASPACIVFRDEP